MRILQPFRLRGTPDSPTLRRMNRSTGDETRRAGFARARRKLVRFVRRNIARTRRRKIFGIGLSRTGTQTLNACLETLGYHSIHNPDHLLQLENGALSFDMVRTNTYEALSDLPIARFYRDLDRAFPGSRFILTVRDKEGLATVVFRLLSPARRPAAARRRGQATSRGDVRHRPVRSRRLLRSV